jgi:Lectin C-type domain
MGLKPIAFETTAELKCLSNFTNSIPSMITRVLSLNTKLGNWTYNFNYWTGATQRGCKGQWAWCTGLSIAPLPDNLTWGFNQPDNRAGGDDCIQMRLMQNSTGVALFDRNCSDKFVIACEVN